MHRIPEVQAQNLMFVDIPLHVSMALYHKKPRSVIHTLARVDSNGDRPNVDQQLVPT